MKSIKDYLYLLAETKFLIQEVELDRSSVDAQIEYYLASYESESQKPKEENIQELNFKEAAMNLLEQPDDLVSKILGQPPKDEEDVEDIGALEDLPPTEEEPVVTPGDEEIPLEEPAAEEPVTDELPELPDELPELPDEPETEEPEAEEPEAEDLEVEEPAEEEPIKSPGEINHSAFAVKVNNFIENFENLLDIKNVILTKALSLVEKNYSEEDVSKLKELLKQNYQLDTEPE